MSTAPQITLRPMTEDEFTSWRERIGVGYAAAIGPARALTPEQALEQSHKEMSQLLPDGLATEGHLLWSACAADGTVVGDLWIHARRPVPFIYDIEVREDQRGHGYGRAIMLAGEEECRQRGFDRLDLNVFGYNTTAIALYDSLGYVVVSQQMRKQLQS
jgi:ribosomal protein S18 acetylase RimI-like enzyme